MQINIEKNGDTVIISPMETIDFVSAPDFEKSIEQNASDAAKLIIDMKGVDYISSAGLRAILFADNLMEGREGMVLRNVNDSVMEILDISGFTSELVIE